ncbi:MCAT [Symbiodinium microadriaticum]|nr:MCAT [Symbiodinium sp. KB8]CAE7278502.1 MCAT [Symbiodinium microadriaticum]
MLKKPRRPKQVWQDRPAQVRGAGVRRHACVSQLPVCRCQSCRRICGTSPGEYTALCVAGAFTFEGKRISAASKRWTMKILLLHTLVVASHVRAIVLETSDTPVTPGKRIKGLLRSDLQGPIFVHIPKTAGTSIWKALGSNFTDSGRYPEVPFFCMKHNPPQEHVPDSWAVVRDPCDRLVSEFAWARLQGWYNRYKADGLDSHATPDCATFNKWVSLVMKAYKTDSEVEDCHMIPQWCYASKVDKLVPMVGDLEQNVRKVDKRLAFLKLNSTNHHSHVLKKYDVGCGCLTPENLKAVQEHFIEDFVHLRQVLGTSKYAPMSASDPNFVVKDSKCAAFHRNGKQLWPEAEDAWHLVSDVERCSLTAEGLKLVSLRGQAMQDAAAVGKQAMLSVAGFEKPKLSGLCDDARKQEGGQAVCQIANELFPKGFSCAGTEKAINILKDLAEKNGALQAKVLKTSGGFHTSLMEPAKQRLAKALDEMLPGMQPLKKTVYMNATAEPLMPGTAPEAVVDLLKKQLTSPVLWEPSMQKMLEAGLTDFYECGPNKQIKAMMKRINAKAWGSTTNVEV